MCSSVCSRFSFSALIPSKKQTLFVFAFQIKATLVFGLVLSPRYLFTISDVRHCIVSLLLLSCSLCIVVRCLFHRIASNRELFCCWCSSLVAVHWVFGSRKLKTYVELFVLFLHIFSLFHLCFARQNKQSCLLMLFCRHGSH